VSLPSGFTFLSQAGAVSIEGIERDWELDIRRGIIWAPPIGSWPRGVPLWRDAVPQKHDTVDFRFTLWCNTANRAKLIEANLPPFAGTRATVDLCFVTGDSVNPIIPGFGNYTASDGWKIVKATLDPVDVMGRKIPGRDLWGYRIIGSFAACGYGTALNERNYTVPTDATPPAWLATKFGSPQIQDASTTPRPLPIAGANLPMVQHGRRRDARAMLGHMELVKAESVINFARAVRMNKFVYPGNGAEYTSPFGPERFGGELAVLREITIRRGAGWWYEGELDLSTTLAF
jgi:hypothetical protein